MDCWVVSRSLHWVVGWNDGQNGTEYRDYSRSRALALAAACDLISQRHMVKCIESRSGVTIQREAIEQYCRDHARRPR
jgi:hypothetical protein